MHGAGGWPRCWGGCRPSRKSLLPAGLSTAAAGLPGRTAGLHSRGPNRIGEGHGQALLTAGGCIDHQLVLAVPLRLPTCMALLISQLGRELGDSRLRSCDLLLKLLFTIGLFRLAGHSETI